MLRVMSDGVRVYSTEDLNNATCFAESHHIKNMAQKTSVVNARTGKVVKDKDGRAWEWNKPL